MYQRISPIRDVIHNYISFTIFEKEVIDSAYFQRLHFVLQNSAAYSAYPCNKNSRFVHSLGVAHLAGRMFIHGLKNARKETLIKFLSEADGYVATAVRAVDNSARTKDEVVESWSKHIGNTARFRRNLQPDEEAKEFLSLQKEAGLKYHEHFIINTFWIALKVCGLAHDIGHLPMSHSFEQSMEDLEDTCHVVCAGKNVELEERLKDRIEETTHVRVEHSFTDREAGIKNEVGDYANLLGLSSKDIEEVLSDLKLHERRSLRILDEISFKSEIENLSRADENYRKLVFLLAKSILLYSKEKSEQGVGFLASLKEIISGDVDADRLDYTVRDAHASGLEVGVFDLDRIVVNFTLIHDEKGERFRFLPGAKSVTAIENFFHQRYLLYCSLVFHRTAVRTKTILRELISRLVIVAFRCEEERCRDEEIFELIKLTDKMGLLKFKRTENGKIKHRIESVLPDDMSTLRNFDDARLRTYFFEISNLIDSFSDEIRKKNDGEIQFIKLLVDTFLFRITRNVISFGKGVVAAQEIRTRLKIDDVNPFVIGGNEEGLNALSTFRKKIFDDYDGQVCVLISILSPRVYQSNKTPPLYAALGGKDKFTPIEQISPFLETQYKLLESEMDFVVSFVSRGVRDDKKLSGALQERYEELIQNIAELIRNKKA